MIRAVGESGVVAPSDAVISGEKLGCFLGVLTDPSHAEMEGFDTLDRLPGVEGGLAGANVAEELQAHLHDEGDVGVTGRREGLEGVPVHQAMVRGVGLGESGKAVGAPVEVPAVDHDAADGGAVATEVFGGGVDNDVGAPLEGTIEDRGERSVIDDERDAGFLCDGGYFLHRENIERRIAETFAEEGFGVGLEGAFEGVGIGGVDEVHLDTQFRQRVVEEIVGSSVELGDGDDVIPAAGDIEDGVGDGGLARGVGEGARATFEGGHTLLEHIGGRIHDPGVDVTELFEAKEIGGVFGIPEHITGGLIKGDRAGAGGGIWSLPCVEGFGAEALRSGHRRGSFRNL